MEGRHSCFDISQSRRCRTIWSTILPMELRSGIGRYEFSAGMVWLHVLVNSGDQPLANCSVCREPEPQFAHWNAPARSTAYADGAPWWWLYTEANAVSIPAIVTGSSIRHVLGEASWFLFIGNISTVTVVASVVILEQKLSAACRLPMLRWRVTQLQRILQSWWSIYVGLNATDYHA